MKDLERKVAMAIMQLKAEPFCTECGGTCIVIMSDIVNAKDSCNIWTACSMCGTEMLWTATPNHIEMLERIVALTIQQKGKVIESHEFIRSTDGLCIGLCGGICPEHWRQDEDAQEDQNICRDIDQSISS